MNIIKYSLIASISWLTYRVGMLWFLGYYGAYHPFLTWATETLIPEHRLIYFMLLYTSDFLLWILLTLPFAFFIKEVLPRKPWPYIALAAISTFIWEYQNVLFDSDALLYFLTTPSTYLGIAMTLGLLPLTFLLIRWRYPQNAA